MPKKLNNVLTVKGVEAKKKRGLYADGGGLYLRVGPSGAKSWILRAVCRGRRRDFGLGAYPVVTLAKARERAEEWRRIIDDGGDPSIREKRRAIPTFEEAAREAHAAQVAAARNPKHRAQWINSLRDHAFPVLGPIRVDAITSRDVQTALEPIWQAKPETARRVRQRIRAVMDWARVQGFTTKANPVLDVGREAMGRQPTRTRHHAALPYADLPALWPRLTAAEGMGALALRLTILTAARSGEVRGAAWDEIDLTGRVWTVPAERMKAERPHRVPLSDAALAVLEQAAPFRDRSGLVFPSLSKPGRPLSDMTLAAVLKRLEVPVTVHGFRSTFRDWCSEVAHAPWEVSEAALAHTIKDKAAAAYARSDLLERRRALMDRWAAFVTGETGAVIPLGRVADGDRQATVSGSK